MPKKKRETGSGNTPPRRQSQRGKVQHPIIADAKVQKNDESYEERFRKLCNLLPNGKKDHSDRRLEKKYTYLRDKQAMKVDPERYNQYSKRYGQFLGKLMAADHEEKVTVPLYLIDRTLLRKYLTNSPK